MVLRLLSHKHRWSFQQAPPIPQLPIAGINYDQKDCRHQIPEAVLDRADYGSEFLSAWLSNHFVGCDCSIMSVSSLIL